MGVSYLIMLLKNAFGVLQFNNILGSLYIKLQVSYFMLSSLLVDFDGLQNCSTKHSTLQMSSFLFDCLLTRHKNAFEFAK